MKKASFVCGQKALFSVISAFAGVIAAQGYSAEAERTADGANITLQAFGKMISSEHKQRGDPMKHIITVQHTQSVHHINGMVGSWTDWDLTELGKKQADKIGRKLKEELAGKKAILFSSDLKRAKQTAEAIAKHLGQEPIFRQELRERNLGRCCGKTVQWLRENIECPETTVDDRMFSDGESRRDAWNRLLPFYDEIMAGDEETVIIVSHGGILSIWNAMFLGLTVESCCHTEIHGPAGGVSHMFVSDDGKHRARHIADMSYLI